MREKKVHPRKNLLDYSIDKYGTELVGDIRRLGRILVLYLPLPLFWTLYDQKGSRWTIQVSALFLLMTCLIECKIERFLDNLDIIFMFSFHRLNE